MSLFGALNTSLSGLRANQVALDVVSRNVANAGTPGYTKKISPRENALVGGQGQGVRILSVTRQVDARLQENLRGEESRSARLSTVADFLKRIDEMFGRPDMQTSLSYTMNEFANSMSELADNPENSGVRKAVVAQADMLARQLNQLSASIQDMRSEAENGLALGVEEVNNALQGIESLNREIANRQAAGLTTADLEDRRDMHLATVSANMDIRTIERGDGIVTVFTSSGHVLVNERAAQISFDSRQVLTPENAYSDEDYERNVGTLTLTSPGGNQVDLLKDGPPRQGKLAAYLELRDERLPEAQAQLDEIAHTLAMALSTRETAATPNATGSTLSFDFAAAPLQQTAAGDTLADGQSMQISYRVSGQERNLTVYFVEDPYNTSLLERVPDPDNSVFVAVPTAFPATPSMAQRIYDAVSGLVNVPSTLFTDPAGGEVLTANSSGSVVVNSFTMNQSWTDTADGPQLNLFRDGNSDRIVQQDYTGRLSDDKWAKVGLAGRIGVNTALLEDDSLLVRYTRADGVEVPDGDNSRPAMLLDRLTEYRYQYSADTGLGDASRPYRGTVLDLGRATVTYQGMEATTTISLAEDQAARTDLLNERHASLSGVNIDDEMAQLILLQSAYSASAKVMQTVDALFEDLLSLRR